MYFLVALTSFWPTLEFLTVLTQAYRKSSGSNVRQTTRKYIRTEPLIHIHAAHAGLAGWPTASTARLRLTLLTAMGMSGKR
jgi:hypothetical protein